MNIGNGIISVSIQRTQLTLSFLVLGHLPRFSFVKDWNVEAVVKPWSAQRGRRRSPNSRSRSIYKDLKPEWANFPNQDSSRYLDILSCFVSRKNFGQPQLKTPSLYWLFGGTIWVIVRFLVYFGAARALDKIGKKWQYLAQNDQKCRFWTKFGRFWAKNPNFYGSK